MKRAQVGYHLLGTEEERPGLSSSLLEDMASAEGKPETAASEADGKPTVESTSDDPAAQPPGDGAATMARDQCGPCEQATALSFRRIFTDLRSMGNRDGLRRIGVLVWTVIACCVSYSTYAFVVYLPALRDRFGMSQSQAEFAMSLTWLGMGSPIFLGFLINRWGPRWGAVVALVLSSGAYMLLFSACQDPEWYREHVYLVALYCFLGGAGSGATSIAGIAAAMRNFTATYRGTIMMFLTSGTALGGLIFKAIYNTMFVNDDDPAHQHLGYFFVVVASSFLVVNLGGIVFYGRFLDDDEGADEGARLITGDVIVRYDEDNDIGTSDHDSKASDTNDSAGEDNASTGSGHSLGSVESRYYPENYNLSLKDTFLHPMFHFISWPCILTQGMYAMTINNVVVFLESFDMLQWRISLPYTADFAQMVCRPLVGFSSDLVKHRISRAWFIVVGCFIDLVIFTLDIFFLDHVWLLFINMMVLGYACVATFTMTPSLLCDEFGIQRFPRNWGLVQGANCVAMFLFCNLISLFYGMYENAQGICASIICYSWTYSITSIFAFFALILIAIYIIRKRRGRRR